MIRLIGTVMIVFFTIYMTLLFGKVPIPILIQQLVAVIGLVAGVILNSGKLKIDKGVENG